MMCSRSSSFGTFSLHHSYPFSFLLIILFELNIMSHSCTHHRSVSHLLKFAGNDWSVSAIESPSETPHLNMLTERKQCQAIAARML